MGIFYKLTDVGFGRLSRCDDDWVVLTDELFADRVDGSADKIVVRDADHWLADYYVDNGSLERVETSGVTGATLTSLVTVNHEGLFAVRSGESILAVVPGYGIARSIASFAASLNDSDVVVCAATPWSAITHMDFMDYLKEEV